MLYYFLSRYITVKFNLGIAARLEFFKMDKKAAAQIINYLELYSN
jgi:hypothetical protein